MLAYAKSRALYLANLKVKSNGLTTDYALAEQFQ